MRNESAETLKEGKYTEIVKDQEPKLRMKNRYQYRNELRRGKRMITLPPGQRADVPSFSS